MYERRLRHMVTPRSSATYAARWSSVSNVKAGQRLRVGQCRSDDGGLGSEASASRAPA
ncbi:MAG: hypothetical protein ACXWQ8_19605 [Ktedonobacterales bacterium]